MWRQVGRGSHARSRKALTDEEAAVMIQKHVRGRHYRRQRRKLMEEHEAEAEVKVCDFLIHFESFCRHFESF